MTVEHCRRLISFTLAGLFLATSLNAQSGRITGIISDSESGDTLPGATVLLLDSDNNQTAGAATNQEGRYEFTSLATASYKLEVSFVGFESVSIDLRLPDGETLENDVELVPTGFNLGTVEITSSRRRERLMDTPSSVSVMGSSEIRYRAGESPADALRTIKGVNTASTGLGTTKITLRGFNSVFSNDVLFLANDRQVNLAAWGLILANIAPGRLDIDKIEVIRGPGASLYGGGADVGVVHYVTKDAFDHPGTTLSLSQGERSYQSIEFRHAGTAGANSKIGYKVNVQHVAGNDWTYDRSDSLDAAVLDRSIDQGFDKNDFIRTQVDAEIAYRFTDERRLTLNAGYGSLTGVSLGGVGRFFADQSQFSYAQIRYRQGRFFAQSYAYQTKNPNNSLFLDVDFDGDGAPDRFIDESFMYTAQVQYDYDFNQKNNLVVGADADWQTPRSRGTLFGIFEERDDTREIGLYAQSRHQVIDRLALNFGVRADHHNVLEDVFLTPRFAAVFTPAPGHRIRASVIRGFSPPQASQLFQDISVGPLFGNVQIIARARPRDIEWERNPAYEALAGSDIAISSILPGLEGTRSAAGIPVDLAYGWIYGGLAGLPASVLAGALGQSGFSATEQQAAIILAQLSPALTNVGGFSPGVFRLLDPASGAFLDPFTPSTVPGRAPRFNTTIEIGYKGLIGKNFIFEIEGYRSRFKNFSGGIINYSPFAFVPTLGDDLIAALADGVSGNDALLSELSAIGISSAAFSEFLISLAGGAPIGPNTPIGIVQPVQEGVPGEGEAPNWYLFSNQSGTITIWGVDTSFEMRPAENWTVFGNISWVHDNIFDPEDAGVDNPDFLVSSNTPRVLGSLGLEYDFKPWSFYAAGRYRGESERVEGIAMYSGIVDAFFIVDASAEYDFPSKLSGLS